MKSIMYHYVQEDDPSLPYFNHLHVDDFKLQLDYFDSTHGYVSKEDFLESLANPKPTSGVVLTFDDGLKCHFRDVYPVLKERGLWGLFYVPTGMYHTGKVLDVHRIHVLLGGGESTAILDELKMIVRPEQLIDIEREDFTKKTYIIQKNDEATTMVKRILNYYISYEYRSQILDQLCEKFVDPKLLLTENFYVTKEELLEMETEGMIIGSHTVNHPVLSKLTVSEQNEEIKPSFETLSSLGLELKTKTFCYPYGGFHSFTNETEEILNHENCLFSFNVESRDIEIRDLTHRRQALPRYDCNEFPYGQVRRLCPPN